MIDMNQVDGSDDGDDSGPGFLAVTGTSSNTLCPSVNPISIGPDNGGLVPVSTTINNLVDDASAFQALWTASYGGFSDPHVLQTTYFCTLAGHITITISLTGLGCNTQESSTIDCSSVVGSE